MCLIRIFLFYLQYKQHSNYTRSFFKLISIQCSLAELVHFRMKKFVKVINFLHEYNEFIKLFYKVQLADYFKEAEDLQFTLNSKVLFDKNDAQNKNLLQQYLPALTTWEKVMKLRKNRND